LTYSQWIVKQNILEHVWLLIKTGIGKKAECIKFYRSGAEMNFGGVVMKLEYKLGTFVGFSLNAFSCEVQ